MLALGLYPLVVVISFVLRPLAWTLQSQWLRMQAADALPALQRPATRHNVPPRVTDTVVRAGGGRPVREARTAVGGGRWRIPLLLPSSPLLDRYIYLIRREWPEIAPENDTRSHGPHRRAAVPHTRRRRGAARPRAAARAADRHARGRRGSRRARLEYPGRRAAVLGCHVCRGVLGRAPTAAAARRGRRCDNNNN